MAATLSRRENYTGDKQGFFFYNGLPFIASTSEANDSTAAHLQRTSNISAARPSEDQKYYHKMNLDASAAARHWFGSMGRKRCVIPLELQFK